MLSADGNGGDADRRVRVFLGMPELSLRDVCKSRRLLRVLQLRHCEMPADSGGHQLLQLSVGFEGAGQAASLVQRSFAAVIGLGS